MGVTNATLSKQRMLVEGHSVCTFKLLILFLFGGSLFFETCSFFLCLGEIIHSNNVYQTLSCLQSYHVVGHLHPKSTF